MTQFKKGDKVRYKKVRGYEEWAGLEAEVLNHEAGWNVEVRATKDPNRQDRTGRTLTLIEENLELIPVTPSVGDKIRANDKVGSTDWIGVEGVITDVVGSDYARFKITANPPAAYSVGCVVSLPLYKFDVIVGSEELPREVKLSEIRAGDRVQVAYPETESHATAGVEERTTVTRTGTVAKIDDWELINASGWLINSRLRGLDEAVYTLLERPEPKRTTATEPIGSQFKTTVGVLGQRLLTKVAEDKWSDIFLKTGNVYTATDSEAQEAFDERAGEWLKV